MLLLSCHREENDKGTGLFLDQELISYHYSSCCSCACRGDHL